MVLSELLVVSLVVLEQWVLLSPLTGNIDVAFGLFLYNHMICVPSFLCHLASDWRCLKTTSLRGSPPLGVRAGDRLTIGCDQHGQRETNRSPRDVPASVL